ncbi:MAG: formylglycine-generating enzyme family protein [Kiritimatiellae bacterium]|nr:formylglycine-generating enzyme family protein [Kiritimatiellia bacterium]
MKSISVFAAAAIVAAGLCGCTTAKSAPGENALYCVIDLSGGPEAGRYPVSYLDEVPKGGWSDEYKTEKLVLRRIEPGEFMMCSRAMVAITKPFYIGVFELTKKQYYLIHGKEPRLIMEKFDPVFNSDWSMQPESGISYNMARGGERGAMWPKSAEVDPGSTIGKLREKTGLKGIDLPTEAQWEYACRAGTTSRYNNGGDTEEDLKLLGRFAGNAGDGKRCRKSITFAGEYLPNAWGIYDMHGNVFEWCLDWGIWDIVECADPVGGEYGDRRCLRGGSIDYRAGECTSDFRYYAYGSPDNESIYFGMRICLNETAGE